MSSDHDELIAQFIEVSGGDENVARFYLSSSNWSLEEALTQFLGTQSESEDDHPASGALGGSLVASRGETAINLRSGGGTEGSADKFAKQSSKKPKFVTLTDMGQQQPPSNEEEEGQAFYAGGSERSGQQVLGPPKRRNFREQLTEMFRMAHEHNLHDALPAPSTSSGTSWGLGVRLGMTDSDHTVITPLASAKNDDKKPVVVLKLWSQGFSVDDGELRLYDDPDNKEFLETVMRGEIPTELLQMGWMVNVDVEDHRQEDYKKKITMKTFKGSGHTLGSPAPNIEENEEPAAAPIEAAAKTAANEKIAKEKLNMNADAPNTTLQIRLADGSRLTAQFNLTHTVADIQQYIQNARPQYANINFILVSSFPTRELTNVTDTIELAGLKCASIMQRLK